MTPAFVTAAPLLNAPRTNAWTKHSTSSIRMNAQTPPESRISANYPINKRFLAPVLSFSVAEGCELMNAVGLNMEEAPLDLDYAAEVAAPLVGTAMMQSYDAESGSSVLDTDTLFPKATTDRLASDVVDKYFPQSRRDETPIISMTDVQSEDASVNISIGKVVATPPPEEVDTRAPSFWKSTPAERSVADIVASAFPIRGRNMAPVIDISLRGLGVSMEAIEGYPEVGTYQPVDSRFFAPNIRIKTPAGDWDTSGFVEVSNEEIQLPLLNSV